MKESVPLLQALCWPLLIAGVCFWLRQPLLRLVQAIAKRIEDGDSFETGPLKFGAQAKLPPDDEPAGASKIDDGEEFPHSLYLLHQARRDRQLDRNGKAYYHLEIWIDANEAEVLEEVESITYYLHPTFDNPVRTITTRDNAFSLKTEAWGQFLLHAIVNRKGASAPLHIERYLNF